MVGNFFVSVFMHVVVFISRHSASLCKHC
jgi:hypothetical protein